MQFKFYTFLMLLLAQSLLAQSINEREPLVAAKEITKMLVFNPVSALTMIGKNLGQEKSDSISELSEKLWLETLYDHKAVLPEIELFATEKLVDSAAYKADLEWLISSANSNRDFQDIRLPPSLYTILEETDCRYAMLTYLSGFRRKKGNMVGEMFKSIGVGVVTAGMYAPIPYSYQSNIYVLIMDKESGHAVFYRESEMPDGNPLGKKTLKVQFKYIFKKYFL